MMYEPIQNKNNYQHIVAQIKQMILDEELKIGDRLPSERDMAEMYQVSRASVREALKALETLGLLECRQGGGNYIVNNLQEQMSDSLSLVCALGHCKPTDLTSLRYSFELETMKDIVKANDPEVRKQFQQLAKEILAAESVEQIHQIDLRFHLLVASLAANPLLQYLQSAIHTAYRKNIEYLNANYPAWHEVPFDVVQKYQLDIINALLSGDIFSIETALKQHYNDHYGNTDPENHFE